MDAANPPVNVYEGNGQISVAAPIPGAHADHTRVTITPDRVRIRAQNKYAQESQNYLRHDWRVGAWEADVPLPRRVDPAGARARLSLGVLVVIAPLSDTGAGEAEPRVEEPHPSSVS